jgi:tRNA A37 threonylcarbamoyladenosine dehydratase
MKKQLNKIAASRLLIIGCGDVGMRLLPLLRQRFRMIAVTSQPAALRELRRQVRCLWWPIWTVAIHWRV